jgi:hypothetical protein
MSSSRPRIIASPRTSWLPPGADRVEQIHERRL